MAGRKVKMGTDPTEAMQVITSAGGTVTPDLAYGRSVTVNCTTIATTVTLAAFLVAGTAANANRDTGTVMRLFIANTSAGVLTAVNLPANVKGVGFVKPAAAKRTSAEFQYDGTNWQQIGAWSGDY